MLALVIATILIPILGSALVLLVPDTTVKRTTLGVAALALAAEVALLAAFAGDGQAPWAINLVSFAGVTALGVTVDNLSVLVGLAVILIGFLICVYSTAYMSAQNREHPEEGTRRYYFFLLLFIGSMEGLVFASTMIGLLVFFELTGLCSWGLIGYYDSPKALRAALKAIILTHVASIGLYVATAFLFATRGSFDLTALAQVNEDGKLVIFFGILIAAWGKSAQLPFHFWLPDAMEAPTPISAYLHAASMVKAGVYIFARTLLAAGSVPHVIGIVGGVMAIATLIYGFVMYFSQKDLKRLLAYSTITQLAYIFLALSFSVFGSTLAFDGAIAQIFNHAFAKTLFFLVVGAIGFTTGTRLLPALRGLVGRMPAVGVGFAVAALAITGVPPLNCFFSKFSIFAGGVEASRENLFLLPLLVIAMLESVGSFAWFLWQFGNTVPGQASEAVAKAIELPRAMKAVLVTLIVLTLVSGYFAAAWMGAGSIPGGVAWGAR